MLIVGVSQGVDRHVIDMPQMRQVAGPGTDGPTSEPQTPPFFLLKCMHPDHPTTSYHIPSCLVYHSYSNIPVVDVQIIPQ